jgi:hypothetical protein
LRILDTCGVDDEDPFSKALEPSFSDALAVGRGSGSHVALCITFDPFRFSDPEICPRRSKL